MSNPKLSVVFITYNHEPFIRQALDSVLMQKTNFDFEVVVGEDCSTDHTRDILREYDAKYPGRLRLLFREKNLGCPTLNVYQTAMECEGEYLAFLEGDDYWTDPYKLQKQVDFLDSHPDYMGTTCTFSLIGEKDEPIVNESLTKLYSWSGDYTFSDWQKAGSWPGQTASNVCRNFFHNKKMDYTILYRAHDFIDDGVIFTFILLQGKIFRFDDVMVAHRYVEKAGGESWNSRKLKRNYLIEECALKRTIMEWVEINAGLTDRAIARAGKEFKTTASVFIKGPSAETWKLFTKGLKYYLHVRFGHPRIRDGSEPAVK